MKKPFCLIIVLLMILHATLAQVIPNSGFESWTNRGIYSNPVEWGCLNNTTAADSIFTCEIGMPGSPGLSFIKLISLSINGGIVPGIAVSGQLDSITYQPKSGFPFSARPMMLTGKWQHMIFGSSQGYIKIILTRWDSGSNTRIPVASARQFLVGMDMSWTDFSIPLSYTDNNLPDTCIIELSASGPNPSNLDFLWVDSLGFSGSVGVAENYYDETICIYPNPSSSELIIDLSAVKNKEVSLQVEDMQGKQLKKMERVPASPNTRIDISELSKGIYFLNAISSEGTITRIFSKQ